MTPATPLPADPQEVARILRDPVLWGRMYGGGSRSLHIDRPRVDEGA